MIIRNLMLSVAALSAFSLTAATETQLVTVWDYDGYNRETMHAAGPVASLQTDSVAGHQLRVYLRRQPGASCQLVNVYAEDGGRYIAPVRITALAANIDFLEADIPSEALTEHRVLEAFCTDKAGAQFRVQHKIPALPKIEWTAELSPAGEFIRQPRGYDYHTALAYQGQLKVNNYSSEAHCESDFSTSWSHPLYLFNGQAGKSNFQEDVFVTRATLQNNKPALSHSVICTNPAGKTRLVKVWELHHENAIPLVYSETFYY